MVRSSLKERFSLKVRFSPKDGFSLKVRFSPKDGFNQGSSTLYPNGSPRATLKLPNVHVSVVPGPWWRVLPSWRASAARTGVY